MSLETSEQSKLETSQLCFHREHGKTRGRPWKPVHSVKRYLNSDTRDITVPMAQRTGKYPTRAAHYQFKARAQELMKLGLLHARCSTLTIRRLSRLLLRAPHEVYRWASWSLVTFASTVIKILDCPSLPWIQAFSQHLHSFHLLRRIL